MADFEFNRAAMRKGQLAAYDVVMDRMRSGQNPTSIVLPTRYGKSDTQRLVQLALKKLGLACGSIALTPGTYLVRQFVSESEAREMAARYHVPLSDALTIRSAFPEDGWFSNGEFCVAMTMQMATQNARIIVQNAMQWRDRCGLPVYMTVDECDETVFGRARGNLIESWLNAGLPLSMWTALADREDGERVPGFEYEEIDSEKATRWRSRPEMQESGEIKRRVDELSGRSTTLRLKAHHETTFAEAWDENPSPLCHLNRLVVDCDLIDESGDSIGRLSEQGPSTVRNVLAQATMNAGVITQAVSHLLCDMKQNKAVDERCTAIVFTGNDRDELSTEDNYHAKLVTDEIARQATLHGFIKPLTVVCATQKSPNEDIADSIEKFVGGHGDILIVKYAAARGLTAPHLKTILDLSTVRTKRAVIQRLMRVATPFCDPSVRTSFRVATAITLADVIGDEIWKTYVQDPGGETVVDTFIEEELVDSWLAEDDVKTSPEIQIGASQLIMFDDSLGLFGEAGQYSLVDKLLNAFPEVKQRRTLPEIIMALRDAGIDISKADTIELMGVGGLPRSEPQGIGSKIDTVRARVNQAAKKYAAQCLTHPHGSEQRQRQYTDAFKKIVAQAKEASHVKNGVRLERIANLETLKNMEAFISSRLSAAERERIYLQETDRNIAARREASGERFT
jgi:hypothetical protein